MERHLFIALQLPAQVKIKLAEMCKGIKKSHSFKTWVHQEDYHVTLAFLGKASHEQLHSLTLAVRETVTNHDVFSLAINHFGFFGNHDRPRIFWAGLKDQPRLYNLQKQVAYSCQEAGFTLEKRPYTPHVTLARKLVTESAQEVVDGDQWWKKEGKELQFEAKNLILYETHFEKHPKYRTVQSFSLNR
ncbi:RNA 2',3'-cyclic phosphodiesterase [Fictibacillus nanhaiensis]|uniref:RNA 2',3'-cyclic phosphodiesterase n=1 Tax=Fictibacillus nanhaiensis TaxID=742169 RepID=UPI001C9812A0|nr:RNA 2',3'-cyclic phosphodiesterase [Fictibacillus nanhaiensis]MBY6035131.1 RNA 2',3'-cyclic phosphodiesterase [Fictibacillus nanhaiensis]